MVDTTRRNILLGIGVGIGLILADETVSTEGDESKSRNGTREDDEHSLDERMAELLDKLNTDEKISLLHQYQPPTDRLNIGAFRTETEGLHGVAWLDKATVFPQVIGLGSTWDSELVERIGSGATRVDSPATTQII